MLLQSLVCEDVEHLGRSPQEHLLLTHNVTSLKEQKQCGVNHNEKGRGGIARGS